MMMNQGGGYNGGGIQQQQPPSIENNDNAMSGGNMSGSGPSGMDVTGGRISSHMPSMKNKIPWCTIFITAGILTIIAVLVMSPWAFGMVQKAIGYTGASIAVFSNGAPTKTGLALHALLLFVLYVAFALIPAQYQPANLICNEL